MDPKLVFRINDNGVGPELLEQVFLERGWIEYDEEIHGDDGWHVWWRTSRFRTGEYARLLPWQWINHFPGCSQITKKDALCRNIRKMRFAHGFHIYNFCPQAFNLPNDYTKFVSEYSNVRQHKSDTPSMWICKPAESSRGRGIFVFSELSDLQYDCNAVVQQYIANPLLIGGYKFDIRVYVSVPSFCPLQIYVHEEGLVRFSTEKYDLARLDNVFSHLTNTSINKYSPAYTAEKDEIGHGCKWTISHLRRYFLQNNINDTHIWPQITNIIILSLLIQAPCAPKISNCFELYGFDILIDESLKAWLLEINFSPSLGYDCQVDVVAKKAMLHDLMDLLDVNDAASSSYEFSTPPKRTSPHHHHHHHHQHQHYHQQQHSYNANDSYTARTAASTSSFASSHKTTTTTNSGSSAAYSHSHNSSNSSRFSTTRPSNNHHYPSRRRPSLSARRRDSNANSNSTRHKLGLNLTSASLAFGSQNDVSGDHPTTGDGGDDDNCSPLIHTHRTDPTPSVSTSLTMAAATTSAMEPRPQSQSQSQSQSQRVHNLSSSQAAASSSSTLMTGGGSKVFESVSRKMGLDSNNNETSSNDISKLRILRRKEPPSYSQKIKMPSPSSLEDNENESLRVGVGVGDKNASSATDKLCGADFSNNSDSGLSSLSSNCEVQQLRDDNNNGSSGNLGDDIINNPMASSTSGAEIVFETNRREARGIHLPGGRRGEERELRDDFTAIPGCDFAENDRSLPISYDTRTVTGNMRGQGVKQVMCPLPASTSTHSITASKRDAPQKPVPIPGKRTKDKSAAAATNSKGKISSPKDLWTRPRTYATANPVKNNNNNNHPSPHRHHPSSNVTSSFREKLAMVPRNLPVVEAARFPNLVHGRNGRPTANRDNPGKNGKAPLSKIPKKTVGRFFLIFPFNEATQKMSSGGKLDPKQVIKEMLRKGVGKKNKQQQQQQQQQQHDGGESLESPEEADRGIWAPVKTGD